MVAYQVVEEDLQNCEVGSYTAFGVCAYLMDAAKREKIIQISDVFLDNRAAQRFVDLCNRLQLDAVHLPEVVEDAISEVV